MTNSIALPVSGKTNIPLTALSILMMLVGFLIVLGMSGTTPTETFLNQARMMLGAGMTLMFVGGRIVIGLEVQTAKPTDDLKTLVLLGNLACLFSIGHLLWGAIGYLMQA